MESHIHTCSGADMSVTMSNSTTVTLIPVKIIDHSGNAMMQYSFVPQQQRDSKFEPVVEGILEIPDDGQGKRSGDVNDNDARKIALELRCTIVPVEQSVLVADSGFMGSNDNIRYKQKYHTFTRIIHARLPPAI